MKKFFYCQLENKLYLENEYVVTKHLFHKWPKNAVSLSTPIIYPGWWKYPYYFPGLMKTPLLCPQTDEKLTVVSTHNIKVHIYLHPLYTRIYLFFLRCVWVDIKCFVVVQRNVICKGWLCVRACACLWKCGCVGVWWVCRCLVWVCRCVGRWGRRQEGVYVKMFWAVE